MGEIFLWEVSGLMTSCATRKPMDLSVLMAVIRYRGVVASICIRATAVSGSTLGFAALVGMTGIEDYGLSIHSHVAPSSRSQQCAKPSSDNERFFHGHLPVIETGSVMTAQRRVESRLDLLPASE